MSTSIKNPKWAKLSGLQQQAIHKLVSKYYPTHQHSSILDQLLGMVFSSWNRSQKPEVPIISHPEAQTFSIGLECFTDRLPPALLTDGTNTKTAELKRGDASLTLQPFQQGKIPKQVSSDTEHVALMDSESLASAIYAEEQRRKLHYEKQNLQILVFLVRKYLYNADEVEPWSPKQDGKPEVSGDDIRKPADASEYLLECASKIYGALHRLNYLRSCG